MEVVKQLCIKSFEIVARNGDCWKAQQGTTYTTTKPKRNERDIIVFSNFWVPVPKKNFVLAES